MSKFKKGDKVVVLEAARLDAIPKRFIGVTYNILYCPGDYVPGYESALQLNQYVIKNEDSKWHISRKNMKLVSRVVEPCVHTPSMRELFIPEEE